MNSSILDAGRGRFGILAGKGGSAGRQLARVEARNTPRTCPACGHVAPENRISQADFACQRCRYTANAGAGGAANTLPGAGPALSDAA